MFKHALINQISWYWNYCKDLVRWNVWKIYVNDISIAFNNTALASNLKKIKVVCYMDCWGKTLNTCWISKFQTDTKNINCSNNLNRIKTFRVFSCAWLHCALKLDVHLFEKWKSKSPKLDFFFSSVHNVFLFIFWIANLFDTTFDYQA